MNGQPVANEPRERVLIIGIDGATWTNLLPRAKSGQMPTLQKLLQEGSWGVLNSTIPALTPPAWASLVTGVNPGKHGIYHFRHTPAGDYYQRRLNISRDIRVPTVWQRAGQHGKTVGVVNVPLSFPVYPVNGFITSDAFAPDPKFSVHPPELNARFGNIDADISHYPKATLGTQHYLEEMLDFIERNERLLIQHTDISTQMMRERSWSFFMIVWLILDRLQHYAWRFCDPANTFQDPIEKQIAERCTQAFKEIDKQIARLLDAAGDNCSVIIASDHGFGATPPTFFHPNRWLAQQGYLKLLPAWHWRRWFLSNIPRPLRSRWKLPIDSKFGKVDWSATRVWSESLEARAIGFRINRAGRFPEGTVSDAEFGPLRDRLVRELKQLKTESGGNVYAKIYLGSDLYQGPHADMGPDIVAILEKPFDAPPSFRRDMLSPNLYSPNKHVIRDGGHEPEGIVALWGKPIRPGQLPPQEIVSITPTALQLLGLESPGELDGKPIASAFKEEFLKTATSGTQSTITQATAATAQPEYSDKDSELVEERLRNLGYLD